MAFAAAAGRRGNGQCAAPAAPERRGGTLGGGQYGFRQGRGRPGQPGDRIRLRFHRAQTRGRSAAPQRRSIAPIPEDGSGGKAGGRRGPRFQQPAHGHQRVQRIADEVHARIRSLARHGRRNLPRRGPGRIPHPATAHLEPPAGARQTHPEREPGGGGNPADAGTADRRGHQADDGGRSGPAHGDGGSRADGAVDPEPGPERPRRHAHRRGPHHRDRRSPAWTRATPAPSSRSSPATT